MIQIVILIRDTNFYTINKFPHPEPKYELIASQYKNFLFFLRKIKASREPVSQDLRFFPTAENNL